MNLPNDQIMKEMAKIAIEHATSMFAEKARELSRTIPDDVSGAEALLMFAKSIDETNLISYGRGQGK